MLADIMTKPCTRFQLQKFNSLIFGLMHNTDVTPLLFDLIFMYVHDAYICVYIFSLQASKIVYATYKMRDMI